jgi:NADPH:quinone reductase-like Zn-dependent oxidoreductase
VVGEEVPAAPKYALIVESVGGRTLGTALGALEPGGTCVSLGVSASAEVTFDARQFFLGGRATLYGFYLFAELEKEPASAGLRRLADLVATGQLAPHIRVARPWTEVAQAAEELIARRFSGKAVLTLD